MDPRLPYADFQGYEQSPANFHHAPSEMNSAGASGGFSTGAYAAPGSSAEPRRGRVFAGNLPWSWNSGRLQQAFSALGPVYDAEVRVEENVGRRWGL